MRGDASRRQRRLGRGATGRMLGLPPGAQTATDVFACVRRGCANSSPCRTPFLLHFPTFPRRSCTLAHTTQIRFRKTFVADAHANPPRTSTGSPPNLGSTVKVEVRSAPRGPTKRIRMSIAGSQPRRRASTQTHPHACMQVYRPTPACKHADVQACRSTGMQAHRHAGMQACRPAIPARIPTGRHESVQGVRGATGRDTWGSRDLVRTILGESRFRVFLDRPPKQANRRSTVLLGQPPCNERMSTARHGQRKHSVQALSVHGPPSKWMNRNPVRIAVICFRTCSASGPQSLAVLRRKSGSRDRLRRAIGPTCAA